MEQEHIRAAEDYLYYVTKLWIQETKKPFTIDKIVVKGIRTKSVWMSIYPKFLSSMIILQDRDSSVKLKLRGVDLYKWLRIRNG